MSVIVFLAAVSDSAADSLVADPEGFQRFMIGGDLTFETPAERTAYYRDGILPNHLRAAVRPSTVDMDKAWAAIHHVLSKQEHPLLAFIDRGGREIRLKPTRRGNAKTGHLLARAFSAAEVQELHRVLLPIDDATFARAFDPEELTALEVYPEVWDEHGLDYVLPWYQILKNFIRDRAEQSQGILVGVS